MLAAVVEAYAVGQRAQVLFYRVRKQMRLVKRPVVVVGALRLAVGVRQLLQRVVPPVVLKLVVEARATALARGLKVGNAQLQRVRAPPQVLLAGVPPFAVVFYLAAQRLRFVVVAVPVGAVAAVVRVFDFAPRPPEKPRRAVRLAFRLPLRAAVARVVRVTVRNV